MLEIKKFNKIIAANWKLNGSIDFIEDYFKNLGIIHHNPDICGVICPSSVFLSNFSSKISPLFLGAQDCSTFNKGSFTGEISALMLKQNNCQFCIVGHSERRQKFSETNKNVKIKAQNLINVGINPIICIGETLEEKKNGLTKEVLYNQIIESLPENNPSIDTIILAYEPIWAIGSGLTPSFDEIIEIHSFLKNDIKTFGNQINIHISPGNHDVGEGPNNAKRDIYLMNFGKSFKHFKLISFFKFSYL